MAIRFSVLEDKKAVLIEAEGAVVAEEILQLRKRAVEVIAETGLMNFIIDLRNLESLERGRSSAIFDLGQSFSDANISVWANTAVLMPLDQGAHEQVELLHTVQINRGRGIINYVESFEEAYSWFAEMARRN